ncbi:hypothetical protein LEP1GSC048_1736 [Leptospira santarosai serovar Shermani str. 1342KT]|nr:hypothetical protein LEP1GSC048_1736 [Leptospira santarosai serovar Shermani str. 1342KT]
MNIKTGLFQENRQEFTDLNGISQRNWGVKMESIDWLWKFQKQFQIKKKGKKIELKSQTKIRAKFFRVG